MTNLKWLSNIYDPKLPNRRFVTYLDQTQEDAQREQDNWLRDKVIGDPKATEHYTQEELRQQGMVGVYAYTEETQEDRAKRLTDFVSGKTNPLRVSLTHGHSNCC